MNILITLACITLLTGIIRSGMPISRYYELQKSRNILAKTVDHLKKETEDLEKETAKIKASPEYAYQVLRDKYHMTEPQEDIMFFAD